MRKSISIRLPDQLLEDAKAYAKGQGVGVTDIIIQGIQAILQPCHSMPEPAKSVVGTPGETVYEPDQVQKAKTPKTRPSKQVAPLVNAMLSGINKRPTVAHHPLCKCGMCKAADPSALLNKSSNKAFFSPKPQAIPTQPDL